MIIKEMYYFLYLIIIEIFIASAVPIAQLCKYYILIGNFQDVSYINLYV